MSKKNIGVLNASDEIDVEYGGTDEADFISLKKSKKISKKERRALEKAAKKAAKKTEESVASVDEKPAETKPVITADMVGKTMEEIIEMMKKPEPEQPKKTDDAMKAFVEKMKQDARGETAVTTTPAEAPVTAALEDARNTFSSALDGINTLKNKMASAKSKKTSALFNHYFEDCIAFYNVLMLTHDEAFAVNTAKDINWGCKEMTYNIDVLAEARDYTSEPVPSDVDRAKYVTAYNALAASTRALYSFIEERTLSSLTVQERFKTVFTWAIDNQLFYNRKGLDMIKRPFVDIDGNYYDFFKQALTGPDAGAMRMDSSVA